MSSTVVVESARRGWQAFLTAMNGRPGVWRVGLAVAAAVLLKPIFVIPFSVLLGRALLLGVALQFAFTAARTWPQAPVLRRMPRWLAPALAVALAAPATAFAIYLCAAGGSLDAFLLVRGRVVGFCLVAGSGLVLGLLTAAGAMVHERLAEVRSQAQQFEAEQSRLQRQALEARLALLQAGIEPQFLLGLLVNVQALVEVGPPRAAGVLKGLTAHLRTALPHLRDDPPTIGHELTRVRTFLELMQMRMPDRLQFSIAVDPELDACRCPPTALLALVDNAVRHGIDPSEAGGRIEVGARLEGSLLRLWVADTGAGMGSQAQPGTGLGSVRERLAAFAGPGASLQLEENAPHGLRAEIVLPALPLPSHGARAKAAPLQAIGV